MIDFESSLADFVRDGYSISAARTSSIHPCGRLTGGMLFRAFIAMLPAVAAATLAFAGDPVADATLSNLCRPELWDLDHINGWQVRWPREFARLAIATQPQQAGALKRLRDAVSFLDRDRSNLQRGLSLHYSVPQPIVLRVIKEIDALSSESTEGSL